jgi:hypothetical protein
MGHESGPVQLNLPTGLVYRYLRYLGANDVPSRHPPRRASSGFFDVRFV